MTYLKFIFVYSVRYVSDFIFCLLHMFIYFIFLFVFLFFVVFCFVYPLLEAPFVERTFFPIELPQYHCQKNLLYMGLFLNSILYHCHFCLFLCLNHSVLIISRGSLKQYNPLALFFSETDLAILSALQFHTNARTSWLFSTERTPCIFIGTVVNPEINWRPMNLNLTLHQHDITLYFYRFVSFVDGFMYLMICKS